MDTHEPGGAGPGTDARNAAPPTRKRWLWVAAGAVLVVALAVGAGAWYLFIRGDAPPRVEAGEAADVLEDENTTSGGTPTDGPTWTLDTSIGSFDDFTSTFVGYRIGEELAGIGGQDAVGRTPNVSGSLTLDGRKISDVEVEVDMTTLESDDSRRDGQLRTRGLETSEFPTATFALTDPIELDTEPTDGTTLTATAAGELALHGVTREVEVPVEAQLVDDTIAVTGSLDVALADYDITAPTGLRVLSVADSGIVEFQLFFTPA